MAEAWACTPCGSSGLARHVLRITCSTYARQRRGIDAAITIVDHRRREIRPPCGRVVAESVTVGKRALQLRHSSFIIGSISQDYFRRLNSGEWGQLRSASLDSPDRGSSCLSGIVQRTGIVEDHARFASLFTPLDCWIVHSLHGRVSTSPSSAESRVPGKRGAA